MADLGTLVTVVTADVSGFTVGMGQAEQAAKRFGQEVPKQMKEAANGLQTFEDKLHGALQGLRGFREVIGLTLGVSIGRTLFEKIHEGAIRAAEGFSEARAAGESFWDSIADGTRNMVGLHTRFEEIKKDTEDLVTLSEKMSGFRAKVDSAERGPDAKSYPFLPGADEGEDAARAALRAANQGARPFREEIAKLESAKERARQAYDVPRGESSIVDQPYDRQLKDLKERAAPFFKKQEEAEKQLSGYADRQIEANEQAAEDDEELTILKADILSSNKAIAEAEKDAADLAKRRVEEFQKDLQEADRKSQERDSLMEGLHPELKRARLRAEAEAAGLSPADLQARFAQIDAMKDVKDKHGPSYANSDSLHDLLQAAVNADPKQAQRDDWQQQQVKALNEINQKIVAPPPGQPNQFQFTA